MRIITGKYKGKRFDVPRTFKARPTTDFAKENLFNVLRAYVDFDETRALDLFAGTGSITLELLSRGCPEVVSVERDRQHFAFIGQVLRSLADPPYALRELPELPEMVLQGTLVRPGGIFVLEHGKDNDFSNHTLFLEHRAYGSVNFTFFRQKCVGETATVSENSTIVG